MASSRSTNEPAGHQILDWNDNRESTGDMKWLYEDRISNSYSDNQIRWDRQAAFLLLSFHSLPQASQTQYYEDDDEEMLETAEIYEHMTGLNFIKIGIPEA